MLGTIGRTAIASGPVGGTPTAIIVSPLTRTAYRFPCPIAAYPVAGTALSAGPSATIYRYGPSGSLAFTGAAVAYRQTRQTITLTRVSGAQASLMNPLGHVPTLDDLTGRQTTLTGVGHG